MTASETSGSGRHPMKAPRPLTDLVVVAAAVVAVAAELPRVGTWTFD